MIDKKGGKWGFDIRVRDPVTGKKTRRLRFYECDTRDQAEAVVAAIKLDERNAKYGLQKPSDGPRLKALIEKRLPDIADKHEHATSRRVLETWLKLFDPEWKLQAKELPDGKPIARIETADIKLYVTKRQEDGRAPSSINRELNIISATLKLAKDYFPELRNWVPPKIPRPKVSKSRRERIITDEEYRRITYYLQRPREPEEGPIAYRDRIRVSLLLRWALLTGMRPKEIRRLKWSDVDWDGKQVKVRSTKTENRKNSVRYLPISPSIHEVLLMRRASGESTEYVFSMSGSRLNVDYDILKKACRVNGIPYGRSVENGFELYCARHTFTTRMLQSGLSLTEVGALTGHSDRELILHYSHITPESIARSIEKIEEIETRRSGREAPAEESQGFPEMTNNLIQ